MSRPIIDVRSVSKRYRLGAIGATSLKEEIPRLWQRLRRGRRLAGAAIPVDSAELWALRDVSFSVQPGDVVGIIGRNGAGKSTLLKILSRITQQTSGEITLRGRVASLLEVGTGFHPDLTGRENVFLNGAILGMTRAEIRRKMDEIVAFAEVDRFIDTPVKRYSSGMHVRLAFAVAAHLEPEILIVDEVLAVGDTAFQKKCLGKMGAVSTEGRTVLFVSHHLLSVQSLCRRGILLEDGRVRADDTSEAVVNKYLAESASPSRLSLADRTDRAGNGDVSFTSVILQGAHGDTVGAFRSGAPARLILRFENRTGRDLEDVLLGLGVDDAMGQRITLWTTDADAAAPRTIPRDVKAIEVRIERLPLLPGRYGFSLYFAVKGAPADWVLNAGCFDVEPGDYYGTGRLPQGQGHVVMDHHFRLVSEEPDDLSPAWSRVEAT